MINLSEIDVVIQGPVSRKKVSGSEMGETEAVIASVRRWLPGAAIILSTWQGAELSGIEVDQVVLSDDPGSFAFADDEKHRNNINRQIVSTSAGLRAARRPYALKLRSDTRLDHAGFLDWFERFPARNAECKILEKRVLAWSVGTMHPGKFPSEANPMRVLFHPSDFVFFGLRQDVMNIWDVPLMVESDMRFFTEGSPRWAVQGMKHRHHPECHLWISFLIKNGWTKVSESWADFNPELLRSSELSLVNNLLLLDQHQFGFHCFKYPFPEGSIWGRQFLRNFTNRDWQILYQKYCDPQHQPPAWETLHWHVLAKDRGRSFLRYYLKWPERTFRWFRDRLRGQKPWPWNY